MSLFSCSEAFCNSNNDNNYNDKKNNQDNAEAANLCTCARKGYAFAYLGLDLCIQACDLRVMV